MKSAAIITTLSIALVSGPALAQELTPDRLRVMEIVESGRGVLIPLNGSLAPLPGTEPSEAEEAIDEAQEISDPLLDTPPAEAEVIAATQEAETITAAAAQVDIPEETELEAEAAVEEVLVEEVEVAVPEVPEAPDAPTDLSIPMQVANVELGDPETIGPYRLWLASYRNKSEAQAGWEQLVKENPQVLANLVPVLVLKELGSDGETFFRLQAGPLQSESDAEAACQSLQNMRLYCTVLGP
ncbi:MAG: SPOR domain-containing protein [Alphaproteobacteria bacterium]|jgi:hypothetical protein